MPADAMAVLGDPQADLAIHESGECFHCGSKCAGEARRSRGRSFCCQGCLAVFEILADNGLAEFYRIEPNAGQRVASVSGANRHRFLDEPEVRSSLVDFESETVTRVTFRIPAIHCVACVWLLENLSRLNPGISRLEVNFLRKEAAVYFETSKVRISEIAGLLASIGYEPDLKLSDLQAPREAPASRKLWLQLGVAGFAFGNLMLLALGVYLGLDAFSGPAFRTFAGWAGLLLSIPVATFSAGPYWLAGWAAVRQRRIAIEAPIVAGIIALFAQSAWEVVTGSGEGYFDSLCGLIFFLLCGRLFQQKTFDHLSFERDYQAFFPLAVTRRLNAASRVDEHLGAHEKTERGGVESQVSLSQLQPGDILIIRNGELIPADSRLLRGEARIDYSFVTGESQPVERPAGERLYAGGRQAGGMIEVEVLKPVSQSYLTSLWNQEAFQKDKSARFETLINAYSRRFTLAVMAVAVGSALFWAWADPSRSIKAFTSVLIVACPCALALASPFALGTAIRCLGRRNIFVKSANAVEALAKVNAVAFDKTGTLTSAGSSGVEFEGYPLDSNEMRKARAVAGQSTHPLSQAIARLPDPDPPLPVQDFAETRGCGVEGTVAGARALLGSAAWLESRGVLGVAARGGSSRDSGTGSHVHLALDGVYRGCFVVGGALRRELREMIDALAPRYEIVLLSGDNDGQRELFASSFGSRARFNQSPLDKLAFIQALQRSGQTVAMVGDGLNDAGALRQSDVGVAVVGDISSFSPASDVIMRSDMLPALPAALAYARDAARIVRLSFLLSGFYNVIGIAIAAAGKLSPVICAVLMPVSSVSVMVFAAGLAAWAAKSRFGREQSGR